MLSLRLNTVHGEPILFDVPQTPSEVKLHQRIDYDVKYEKFIGWYADHMNKGTILQQKNRYIAKALVPLSAFYGINLGRMLDLDVADLLDADGEVSTRRFTDHIKRLGKKGIQIDVDSLENTVLELFALVDAACKYTGEDRTETDHTFQFKDTDSDQTVTWTIPYWITSKLSGSQRPTKISVMQAVEVLDLKRKSVKVKEPKGQEGSARYSQYLRTLAMLARKEGEEDGFLYESETELETFLEERAAHFREIDMKTAYDVIFFLINTTVSSLTIPQIVSFLASSLPPQLVKSN